MASERCKEHQRYSCTDSKCTSDNASAVTMNTDGNLALGIGGGLAVDLSDGSIGIQVGGITIDT